MEPLNPFELGSPVFAKLEPLQHQHFIVTRKGDAEMQQLLSKYPSARHLYHVHVVPKEHEGSMPADILSAPLLRDLGKLPYLPFKILKDDFPWWRPYGQYF